MASLDDCRVVSAAVSGLCEPLHEVVQEAWEEADRFFVERDMAESDHRGGRAHLARHLMRRELRARGAIDGWSMAPGCPPNSQVSLNRGAMRLRLLRPGVLGTVPPPGPNRARVRYYSNPQLGLFGAEASNLIAVWEVEQGGDAAIRVVRTTGPWGSLGSEQVDIDFLLPRLADNVADLVFEPSDEGLDLPFGLLADEDDEGDDDGIIGSAGR